MSQIISPFSSSDSRSPPEERARSLLREGQTELAKKNLDQALDRFASASSLNPKDGPMHLDQGLSLLDFGTREESEKALLFANKKFKIAAALEPENFESRYFWGVSLSHLGTITEKFHYFSEAEEKFLSASERLKGVDPDTLSDFHAERGKVRSRIARRSKEAYDWRLCIDDYEKAVEITPMQTSDFWNDFGDSCLESSELLFDLKLRLRAIECYKCAVSSDPNDPESWKNLSVAMAKLYEQTHDEEHFLQATSCFEACIALDEEDQSVHFLQALFLSKAASITRDRVKVHAALEKWEQTGRIEQGEENERDFLPAAYRGEMISLAGELSENIEWIREGRNKIEAALDRESENPDIWACLGRSYISLGAYFDDEDYYYQAVEKFQAGLSIDRTLDELWICIGDCYTKIGISTQDPEILKKALYFYRKGIDLQPSVSTYHLAKAKCLSAIGELLMEEVWIESSIRCFEQALEIQKNSIYTHPDWLFEYAKTLDLYADFFEEESYYHKAIEIFLHVLVINPDFPEIHYRLALAYSHLAELLEDGRNFLRAVHFFKLALKRDENNPGIRVDFAVTLMNAAGYATEPGEKESYYELAENKLKSAALDGNLQSYYQLACLHSLRNNPEAALSFLKRADSFGALPCIEDLLQDEWLEGVRELDSFKDFLSHLEKKATLREEL